MPILHLDLDHLAQALPEAQRKSFLALPVADQLVGIATLAHIGHDDAVRDRALAALAAIRAPAFIGLDAVRTTLQSCAMLNRIPAERCEFLVAALGAGAPARAGEHAIGKWYRKTDDRWLLTVTPHDMALAARAARS